MFDCAFIHSPSLVASVSCTSWSRLVATGNNRHRKPAAIHSSSTCYVKLGRVAWLHDRGGKQLQAGTSKKFKAVSIDP